MNETGYLAGMEDIGSEMMERTLALREGFCEEASEADVQRAIGAKNRSLRDFAALLSVRGRAFGADRPCRSARKSSAFWQQHRRFHADLHLKLLRQSVRLLRL